MRIQQFIIPKILVTKQVIEAKYMVGRE
jgi:hypothetical protein